MSKKYRIITLSMKTQFLTLALSVLSYTNLGLNSITLAQNNEIVLTKMMKLSI